MLYKCANIVSSLSNKHFPLRQEPWSSGYGRRLMFQRSWVQIPAPYTGWTFFHIYLLQNCNVVWKDGNKWKRGRDGQFNKTFFCLLHKRKSRVRFWNSFSFFGDGNSPGAGIVEICREQNRDRVVADVVVVFLQKINFDFRFGAKTQSCELFDWHFAVITMPNDQS